MLHFRPKKSKNWCVADRSFCSPARVGAISMLSSAKNWAWMDILGDTDHFTPTVSRWRSRPFIKAL